jgi:hypothetical protein
MMPAFLSAKENNGIANMAIKDLAILKIQIETDH